MFHQLLRQQSNELVLVLQEMFHHKFGSNSISSCSCSRRCSISLFGSNPTGQCSRGSKKPQQKEESSSAVNCRPSNKEEGAL